MKRVVASLLAVVMVFALAVSSSALISPTPEDVWKVTVDVDGNGDANADKYQIKQGSDGEVTLTAIEVDTFINWTIEGTYDIISGSLTSKVLVIRPHSDIHATAHFKGNGGDNGGNDSNTSPKTGDPLFFALGIMMLAVAGGVISIKRIKG